MALFYGFALSLMSDFGEKPRFSLSASHPICSVLLWIMCTTKPGLTQTFRWGSKDLNDFLKGSWEPRGPRTTL